MLYNPTIKKDGEISKNVLSFYFIICYNIICGSVLQNPSDRKSEYMEKTLENLSRLIVVCGHFGAGKTNFAVNLAKKLAREGNPVTLIDMDIVNPYFRAADNTEELTALGVRCIVPDFANTNVDIPSLPPTILGAFETSLREPERYTIIDLGGDNGAVALGMYNRFFKEGSYDMLCAVSMYRPLTEEHADAVNVLREIEWSARLRVTGLVNTSNLGAETTADDVLDSIPWAETLADTCGLPLVCTVAASRLADALGSRKDLFFIENATKQLY